MNTCTTPIECNDLTTRVSPTPGIISRLISAVGVRLESHIKRRQEYRQHRINRLAFRTVLKLDDNMLNDIGLTRHDVLWADQLPMSKSAAKELNKIKNERRRVASRD
ncbi:MAG: DUF1127 domain-containing protein [Rhizobiaceae bacterium]|nr:DUF1127 domain-containing protein [Rhizobiaceae bacterium]